MPRSPADIVADLAALAARQAALTAELALALRDALAVPPVPAANDAPAYLTTAEAAEVLGVSERTLKTLRAEGRGQRFVRLGRAVRYSPLRPAQLHGGAVAAPSARDPRRGRVSHRQT